MMILNHFQSVPLPMCIPGPFHSWHLPIEWHTTQWISWQMVHLRAVVFILLPATDELRYSVDQFLHPAALYNRHHEETDNQVCGPIRNQEPRYFAQSNFDGWASEDLQHAGWRHGHLQRHHMVELGRVHCAYHLASLLWNHLLPQYFSHLWISFCWNSIHLWGIFLRNVHLKFFLLVL